MTTLFHREKFHSVLHLAAQAGVRYSLVNPRAYVRSNGEGTLRVLDAPAESFLDPLLTERSETSLLVACRA